MQAASLASTVDGEEGKARAAPGSRDAFARGQTARKILIVDDELWAALDMEWVVHKLGHEVIGPAATAEMAVSLADELRPDLVLMDVRLAYKGDGIAAAVEIERRFNISSIFVTAHGDPSTRDRARAAHPKGFIEKPFTPEALSKAIETALDLRGTRD